MFLWIGCSLLSEYLVWINFFENLPVLPLIKLAALGNLKASFHCAHLHSFFPLKKDFSKTYPSFLILKEGSTSLSKPLPSQKGKDVPTALSIVFTTPSVPPCRGQKRCSNRFAIWMADHQRSTPAAELRFFVRGWTARTHDAGCLLDADGTAWIRWRMLDADCSQLAGIAAYGDAGTRIEACCLGAILLMLWLQHK